MAGVWRAKHEPLVTLAITFGMVPLPIVDRRRCLQVSKLYLRLAPWVAKEIGYFRPPG